MLGFYSMIKEESFRAELEKLAYTQDTSDHVIDAIKTRQAQGGPLDLDELHLVSNPDAARSAMKMPETTVEMPNQDDMLKLKKIKMRSNMGQALSHEETSFLNSPKLKNR